MYNLIEFLEMDNEICQQQCLQGPYVQSLALSMKDRDKGDVVLEDHTSPIDM